MDMYATCTGSDRCRVTPFPDLEKTTMFNRFCTPCQGFLMYMNITKVDGSLEDKLCLWKLQSGGWQLISEISPDLTLAGLDCSPPLMINPLDAKTAYFWSEKQERLLSINLHNGKKFVIHNQFEARISLTSQIERVPFNARRYFIPFILPQWLHRIPNTVSIIQPLTTTAILHG
ncbi:unnamed protein product [Eruca vesicaria subsp. sativa]|uniref:F-box protein At3g26010-like beta-propeller domain-containing protein n=1 Tax=Eruca vesicaria subsp. sativa TaxID=29727 RepID=A0ABC8K8Q1_ERUVS|nr:unnamed protein product [Eruca vesicaria subsp. sativa]